MVSPRLADKPLDDFAQLDCCGGGSGYLRIGSLPRRRSYQTRLVHCDPAASVGLALSAARRRQALQNPQRRWTVRNPELQKMDEVFNYLRSQQTKDAQHRKETFRLEQAHDR